MSRSAFVRIEAESPAAARRWPAGDGVRVDSLPVDTSLDDSSAFTKQPDGLYVSTQKAIGGAKGAMMAIAIEAAVVLLPVAIWLIWRVFR
jgi:hypothetical protein